VAVMTCSGVDTTEIITTAGFQVTKRNEGNTFLYRNNQYVLDKQILGRGSLHTSICMHVSIGKYFDHLKSNSLLIYCQG
jgi:hypothetical protein